MLVSLGETGLAVIEHQQRFGALRHLNGTDCHAGWNESVVPFCPDLLAHLDLAIQDKDLGIRVAEARLALEATVKADFQRAGASVFIKGKHLVVTSLETGQVELLEVGSGVPAGYSDPGL